MKIKYLFSLCLAGASLPMIAQTHVEGAEYYNADQLENAKELLERNFKNSGTDRSVANYYLGLIALDNKDLASAQKYFTEGMSANPENAYNYAGLGAVALRNGNAKEAEKFFKEGDSKAKKDAAYSIAVARAYYDADPVLYEKEIMKRDEKARKTNIKEPAIYIFEGDMKKDKDDAGGAASLYEMAASYDPNFTPAYVKYANLFKVANPKYAVDMLVKLLQQNQNSALGQRELANAYYNLKDYENAAKEYGKYVNNENHFKQDEDRYSFLLFYNGQYKPGYEFATKLLNANPNNFTARRFQFMNAAQLPELSAQLPDMADALYKAHLSNPAANKMASIDYTLISEEFKNAKRFDDAVKVLQGAIKEDPENANYYKQLAMAYVEMDGSADAQGNPRKTMADAAKAYNGFLAKTAEPGFNEWIQQAAFDYYAGVENKKDDAALAEKMFADAEKYLKMAAEKYPDQYRPKMMLGDIAMQRATNDAAVASAAQPFYEEAITLIANSEPTNTVKNHAKTMYNYLGNYYLDKKDVAKAKTFFNKYLELDPDNADYRKFVNSLK